MGQFYTYRGALSDIAYFDCINSAIHSMIYKDRQDQAPGFVEPTFAIQNISLVNQAFENRHLSASEILPNAEYISEEYFPYKSDDMTDEEENKTVSQPPIDFGYRIAIRQIQACDIIGSDNVIAARASYLLRKFLLSEEGKEHDINLFNILIRNQIENPEDRNKYPDGAKITDQPHAKYATFCFSIKSTMEKIYRYNETVGYVKTDKGVYDYVMNLVDRFMTIAKYEYAPSQFCYGTKMVDIVYSLNIPGEEEYKIIENYFRGILSVYDYLEKDPESRFPILCKELFSNI